MKRRRTSRKQTRRTPGAPPPSDGFAAIFRSLLARMPSSDGNPYTLDEIARGTDLSVTYLGMLRSGRRANPSTDAMRRLAEFFGVPIGIVSGELSIKTLPAAAEIRGLLTSLNEAEVALADRSIATAAKLLDGVSARLPISAPFGLHARVRRLQGKLHRLRGEADDALHLLFDAVAICRTSGAHLELLRALTELGALYGDLHHYRQAEHTYIQALKDHLARHLRESESAASLRSRCLLGLGVVQRHLGRLNESAANLSKAVELAQGLANARRTAPDSSELRRLHQTVQEPALALHASAQALAIYYARDDMSLLGNAQREFAVTLLHLQRVDECRTLLERSKTIHQAIGDDCGLADDCLAFSRLMWSAGDEAQASAWARRARDHGSSLPVPRPLGEATLMLARLADRAGHRADAEKRLADAIQLFEKYRLTFDLAVALQQYADCCDRWGRWEQAMGLYRRSLEVLQTYRGILTTSTPAK